MKKVIQAPLRGKNVIKGNNPVEPKKPSVADVKNALDVLGRAGGFKISREILTAADVVL